jgi:hypothetical protein
VTSATAHPPVVYLSASKTTFESEQYDRVLDYIARAFPGVTILDAAELWQSAEHWRTQYQTVLAPVTHLFILPNAWGYVGRGSYVEWEFLAPTVSFCGAFLPDDGLWTPITLILDDPRDWVNHAIIHHLGTGQLSVSAVSHGS